MDIIRHILVSVQARLLERLGLGDEVADVLNLVDRDVRQVWGGERAYIAKTPEAEVIGSARRDLAIRRAWKDGEPVQIIAERHGIHRSRVYQIVRGTR